MKLSDYVVAFLESYGVEDSFLLSGVNIMHILDFVGGSVGIHISYNLNEQASSFYADYYVQTHNKLGVSKYGNQPFGSYKCHHRRGTSILRFGDFRSSVY